jgi:hypothetical protein
VRSLLGVLVLGRHPVRVLGRVLAAVAQIHLHQLKMTLASRQ